MFAPRPTAPSLIPWSILSRIPPGLSPFPPFLPPLRAARQPARTSPRRAPTSARPPDSPESPKPGSRHHCPRDAPALGRLSRLPFLAAPRACGMPSVCSPRFPRYRPRPRLRHLPKPLLVPGSRNLPALRPRLCAPSPSRARSEGPPRAKGAGPWHSDGSTDGPRPSPAGPDACLPNPRRGAAALPRPFPSPPTPAHLPG